MSRQNSFESFGLQVSPDGKRFLGWTIIKLGDGSWDLKKPGDDVPKDIDLSIPPQYFREKGEAEEALRELKIDVIEEGGGEKRQLIRKYGDDLRYTLIEEDREYLLGLQWELRWRKVIEWILKKKLNQPFSISEVERATNVKISSAYDLRSAIDRVAYGYKIYEEKGSLQRYGETRYYLCFVQQDPEVTARRARGSNY